MTEEEKQESQVVDELHSLTNQLVTAVKALWESEESRKLRQDIGDGFVELGQQIDEAVKSAQDSEAAKEFKEQVKDTVDRARESDVADQMERNLVSGLQKLNAELTKFVDSLSTAKTPSAEAESEATPAGEDEV
ncbi:MAG: hypothetical protein ACK2U2_07160 [Anaerolineae bacterium]